MSFWNLLIHLYIDGDIYKFADECFRITETENMIGVSLLDWFLQEYIPVQVNRMMSLNDAFSAKYGTASTATPNANTAAKSIQNINEMLTAMRPSDGMGYFPALPHKNSMQFRLQRILESDWHIWLKYCNEHDLCLMHQFELNVRAVYWTLSFHIVNGPCTGWKSAYREHYRDIQTVFNGMTAEKLCMKDGGDIIEKDIARSVFSSDIAREMLRMIIGLYVISSHTIGYRQWMSYIITAVIGVVNQQYWRSTVDDDISMLLSPRTRSMMHRVVDPFNDAYKGGITLRMNASYNTYLISRGVINQLLESIMIIDKSGVIHYDDVTWLNMHGRAMEALSQMNKDVYEYYTSRADLTIITVKWLSTLFTASLPHDNIIVLWDFLIAGKCYKLSFHTRTVRLVASCLVYMKSYMPAHIATEGDMLGALDRITACGAFDANECVIKISNNAYYTAAANVDDVPGTAHVNENGRS